ncbi:MAG: EAL domain-containing protein [Lachnospirales bacterium]
MFKKGIILLLLAYIYSLIIYSIIHFTGILNNDLYFFLVIYFSVLSLALLGNCFNKYYLRKLPNKMIKNEEFDPLDENVEIDFFTKLLNKDGFKKEFYLKNENTNKHISALFFIDIENLKAINDQFGLYKGNEVILKMSEFLDFFNQYNGTFARVSGDQFLLYLSGYDTKDEVIKIFNDFYTFVSKQKINIKNEFSFNIRFSSGVSWYNEDTNDFDELFKYAKFALYEAKTKAKGTLLHFNLKDFNANKFLMENSFEINNLLENNLLKFMYQPIVDVKTAEIFGYEALMRSKLDAFKSPYEIIKVATNQGKLYQLEKSVVFLVHEDICENSDKIGNKKIFINTIPSQVLNEEDGQLLVEKYKENFSRVVIEVTEQESKNAYYLEQKKAFLNNFNILMAVDDFGSGYSNEIRVLEIEPDIVKIDMELIRNIHKNLDKLHIVNNIISFAHSKNMKVVAEGVETKEELVCLKNINVDFLQGYFIAKPSYEFLDITENIKKEILEA